MPTLTCPNCTIIQPSTRKFCDNCGHGPLLSADTNPGFVRHDTLPGVQGVADKSTLCASQGDLKVKLEFKHLHLEAAKHGCIPFRLTNQNAKRLKKISVSIKSTAFLGSAPCTIDRGLNLLPGDSIETRFCDFDIVAIDGTYSVRIQGCYFDEDDNPYAFRGSFSVLVRDPLATKPSIIVEDGGAGMAEEIDISAVKEIIVRDAGAFDMGILQADNSHQELSAWSTVYLEENLEYSRILEDRVSESANPVPPVCKAVAKIPADSMAVLSFKDQNSMRRVQICPRKKCVMGRSPQDADLITVLLPANEENNQQSNKISKRHCQLDIKHNVVALTDVSSSNGTLVDGRELTGTVNLANGQLINLAKVLSFRYFDFRRYNDLQEVSKAFNNCQTMLDCTTALTTFDIDAVREKAPLDAFVIKRQDSFQDKLEYLFLINTVVIGSAKTAAIQIHHDSVAKQHARLRLFRGQYYIEDLKSSAGTRVNGRRIAPGVSEPLLRETTISIGGVEMDFRIV